MQPVQPDTNDATADNSLGFRVKRAFDLERQFERMARFIVVRPYKFLLASLLLTLAMGGGWSMQFAETRPEKQWVPTGAVALAHKEYVEATWPGELSFSAWIAVPAEEGGNMLSAEVLRELHEIDLRIKALKVDGGAAAKAALPDIDAATLGEVDGEWAYEADGDVQRKCYRFGPSCGQSSILALFRNDDKVIDRLTDEQALRAVRRWEGQSQRCIVSIAVEDSPCFAPDAWVSGADPDACQAYESDGDRADCRTATNLYCADRCADPDADGCKDSGCGLAAFFNSLALRNASAPAGLAGAPEFEPFALSTVASSGDGPAKDASGAYASAAALRGAYFLQSSPITVGGEAVDVVAEAWEREALCELGIAVGGKAAAECALPEHVRFTALFSRSFGDEFGGAIRGDLLLLGLAVLGIAAYMTLMISPCDPVHSMIGVSLGTVGITLAAYVCTTGLGSYFGVFTSQLSNLVPFLLLGLGVDDAFVLVGEYSRATLATPGASVEERVVAAVRHGGVSILITSVTDALAFLVGSSTLLPALQSFCIYAGMGILFCFLFQLSVFVPMLLLDARRAEAKRYDLCCCCASKREHTFDEPRGGCCVAAVTGVKFPKDSLQRAIGAFARRIVSRPGKAAVLLLFAGVFGVGVAGATQIYADFKLEWFIPDGSYVNEFFALNEKYFATGTSFSVYTVDGDYFKQQARLADVSAYLQASPLLDQDAGISDWGEAFRAHALAEHAGAVDKGGLFEEEGAYYAALLQWLHGAGAEFSSALKWEDAQCDEPDEWQGCARGDGIKASRISAQTALARTNVGRDRYDALVTLRADLSALLPGAFPYAGTFLYWEETGVIYVELARNLAICSAVIVLIIGLLISEKRAAVSAAARTGARPPLRALLRAPSARALRARCAALTRCSALAVSHRAPSAGAGGGGGADGGGRGGGLPALVGRDHLGREHHLHFDQRRAHRRLLGARRAHVRRRGGQRGRARGRSAHAHRPLRLQRRHVHARRGARALDVGVVCVPRLLPGALPHRAARWGPRARAAARAARAARRQPREDAKRRAGGRAGERAAHEGGGGRDRVSPGRTKRRGEAGQCTAAFSPSGWPSPRSSPACVSRATPGPRSQWSR